MSPPTAQQRRAAGVLLALACLAGVGLLFALTAGSLPLTLGELLSALLGQGPDLGQTVLWELRLPRALSAFAVGGMLALAGALIQVLLRNPLGDPYVLGVSGGAAAGTLLALLVGASGAWVTGSAWLGALGSMALVFGLAHGSGAWGTTRLLLTGAIVAAGWGALISLLLALSPAARIPGMLFWLMGDLSDARAPGLPLGVLGAGLVAGLGMARSLNLLARGELQAAALGVEVARLRLGVFLLASLVTAAAVTVAGSIGFIGLVVPHVVRLIAGSDHRLLVPAAILLGGTLLLLADTLARTLLAPQQLPAGVITALLGVPAFLYLLNREARRPG